MIRRKGLLWFLGFWGVVVLLLALHGGALADGVLILLFPGILLAGSLIAVGRGWPRPRSGATFYLPVMLPAAWRRWLLDETELRPSG